MVKMPVAVNERTSEIGVSRAVGALRKQIQDVFHMDSIFLAITQAASGFVSYTPPTLPTLCGR